MILLITGGAGFIGSHFSKMCLDLGHRVVVLDDLTYAGNLSNLDQAFRHDDFRFVKGDVCYAEGVTTLLEEESPDVVVNFAAESHVDRSISDAEPFVRTNVLGTTTLLDSVLRSSPTTVFVQVSTDEVYGSSDGEAFREDSPIRPSSPYSASKAGADLLALSYERTHGMDVRITRCGNNYGTHHFPEKLIPLFITNLFEGKKVPLYGDGLQVRDWIHVRDHCRGILAVVEDGRSGEVYNFGGGSPKTNLEVTTLLLELTGRGQEYVERVQDRPGHDRAYVVDFEKAKEELGWIPSMDFRQGLEDTVSWYRENERWWTDIRSGEYMEYYKRQYGDQGA